MVVAIAIAEFLVGCFIALAGYFQWSDAEGHWQRWVVAAERIPKMLRFLSPRWMYKGRLGLLQMRIGGLIIMLSSLILFAAAIATLVSGR
jgi:hypothetical protein